MIHKSNEKTIKVGEIVIVKEEDRQRGTWEMGRLDKLFVGNDGINKGIRIKRAKGFLQRPAQLLYPMELDCDNTTDDRNETELELTKAGNF